MNDDVDRKSDIYADICSASGAAYRWERIARIPQPFCVRVLQLVPSALGSRDRAWDISRSLKCFHGISLIVNYAIMA